MWDEHGYVALAVDAEAHGAECPRRGLGCGAGESAGNPHFDHCPTPRKTEGKQSGRNPNLGGFRDRPHGSTYDFFNDGLHPCQPG